MKLTHSVGVGDVGNARWCESCGNITVVSIRELIDVVDDDGRFVETITNVVGDKCLWCGRSKESTL